MSDQSLETSLADLMKKVEGKDKNQEDAASRTKVVYLNPFKATVKEIRTACQSNPDHPKTSEMLNAVLKFPDGLKIVVDRVDLQAILENREVETVEEIKKIGTDPLERNTIRKVLGKVIQKKTVSEVRTKTDERKPSKDNK